MEDIKLKSTISDDKLCSPKQGEEVVISGMAGYFPNTDNVRELRDNLFKKVDLISGDSRRWKPTRSDVPQRTGKLNDIVSFDAGFFGIRHRHANNMDPQIRMILERTFEAIIDAGYNPSELKGTKTGVFIGSCVSETEKSLLFKAPIRNGGSVVGFIQSMMAHYISYCFELEGPSYIADSACCSSMHAIEEACRSLRDGICDTAIVTSANLLLHPLVSQQFTLLGTLSMDGICKVFSEDADGYARSEMVCAILLQKAKHARRIYANIVHCKLNCDGYKKQGVTHPCSKTQTTLLKEIYNECGVDVKDLSYVEAHGTGTHVGDIKELNSMVNVFCSKRHSPLYVGAIKTNLGHSEPTAALASIIKVLLAMECGYIPPNLTHSKPREGIDALVNGQMILVSDKMAWPNPNGLAGVTAIGLGGSNGHLVLHWNEKLKINGGLPEDNLPRLICASGRTPQAVDNIWDDLSKGNLDSEFIKLLHTVFAKDVIGHQFRGYQILTKMAEVTRSVKEVPITGRKLFWIFSNFEAKWPVVGKQLLTFPIFKETLEKIQVVLGQEFKIVKMIRNFDEKILMNQMMTTMAIQLCLADILKDLGIFPDFVDGVGTGELVAAYVDNHLTISEVVSAHLSLALAFQQMRRGKIVKDSSICKELLNKLNNHMSKSFGKSPLQKLSLGVHFLDRVMSPMKFKETTKFEDGDVLVIGAKAKDPQFVSLVSEDADDYIIDFLTTLGKLYESGHDMHLEKLYPVITWPVSRNTPMISPLIKWDHTHEWYVAFYNNEDEIINGQRLVKVNIKEEEWNFIAGYIIDGKILFPNTGYLKIVWETLALMTSKLPSEMRIAFENVNFFRTIYLVDKESFSLVVTIQRGNGYFEITEDQDIVVTGVIYEVDDAKQEELEDSKNSRSVAIMQQEDIYKELRIRGYLYEGAFKSLEYCEVNEGKGLIIWSENWVAFMEAMLQNVLLQMHTKEMHLLVNFEQVIIDAPKHVNFTDKLNKVPVKVYHHLNFVRSGGIEFRGIKFNTITKITFPAPVLQAYKFIANKATLSLEQSVTTMVQIILENKLTQKIKSVEVASGLELLSTYIQQAIDNIPLVTTELVILPKTSLVEKELSKMRNSLIIITYNLFQQEGLLEIALDAVKETEGYVITRESVDFDLSSIIQKDLNVLCIHHTNTECLILLQRTECVPSTFVEVSDDLEWLPLAEGAVKSGQKLIMYSQKASRSGVLGLTNCLRLEPNSRNVSCFLILDDAPEFNPNHQFYQNQLQKNLVVNVWKSGEWGTYRFIPLTQNLNIGDCYANVTGLSRIQLQQCYEPPSGSELIVANYLGLNFEDKIMASCKFPVDVNSNIPSEKGRKLVLDCSGRNVNGKRVMGLTHSMSSQVKANSSFIWDIPDAWSLEDAATVPAVYSTVIYALVMKANIKRGQSILICSRTVGAREAAINVSLYFDCNVFVIVDNKEERDYLRLNYPQIKNSGISNSYDLSFEETIFLHTKGRGVDIILNAQLKEEFLSPLRCLTQNGHFLYVGIPQPAFANSLNLALLSKGATFHGVEMEAILREKWELKTKLSYHITDLVKRGVVKPLLRKVFQKNEISDAFNFMASERYTERVLILMRREELAVEDLPRFWCDPEGVYVILGGLGGFGLQLADWFVQKGAKKLILTSRTGVKNGFQSRMIMLWQSYGVEVVVRTDDVTTRKGCAELITYANFLGTVKAVFNLAAIIKDTLFESQTVENFQVSSEPKAIATHHLDLVTREMCPHLRYFVVFSSVVSGIGNAGQSNYGMSNSVMERICEQRKADGLPGLAIQWGPIDDVGLMMETENASTIWTKFGIMQQEIVSCFEVLEVLLEQDEPIVSSMVLADKSSPSGAADNIVDAVLWILAFSDLKNVNLHSTFPELGMDSLTSVEIQQMLEKDYEVFLSVEDLMAMTLTKLQDVAERKATTQDSKEKKGETNKSN